MKKSLLAAAFFWGTQYLLTLFPPETLSGPAPVRNERIPPVSSESAAVLISPQNIMSGDLIRVLAASESPAPDVSLFLQDASGRIRPIKTETGGGPPFWWSAEFRIRGEGRYVVALTEGSTSLSRLEFQVPSGRKGAAGSSAVWPNERKWGRDTENLYSAWLDALFKGADERSSWKNLGAVLADPQRNLLFNHLGLDEDNPSGNNPQEIRPDCADNPFFLRAYFSWKMRLPFGFHECTRGSLDKAPSCGRWLTNGLKSTAAGEIQAFHRFLRLILNAIHSGTARTALEDDGSDYYPLPLARNALRPGTVFADPYGHTLVIVRWEPQAAERPGLLLAVDAQPDGTVGIKRFWKGNFLFNTKEVVGEPGFKAFRPIFEENGRIRLPGNEEIAGNPEYGNFSLQQKGMESAEFYETLERLINPQPLDPVSAFRDLFAALHEQLIVRVESVSNGEAYMQAHPGTIIPMPSGPAVFQTIGLWEDYSTPNRDMRLLIAIDTLDEFPARILKSPDRFRIPKSKKPADIIEELNALRAKWASELSITYTRSDGNPQILTLQEVLRRKDAFEMGYNPNDGIEIRWGAPEGSRELAVCRRRAPAAQRAKMEALRHWFRKRLHPPT